MCYSSRITLLFYNTYPNVYTEAGIVTSHEFVNGINNICVRLEGQNVPMI